MNKAYYKKRIKQIMPIDGSLKMRAYYLSGTKESPVLESEPVYALAVVETWDDEVIYTQVSPVVRDGDDYFKFFDAETEDSANYIGVMTEEERSTKKPAAFFLTEIDFYFKKEERRKEVKK